jgi:hypothetical protein
MGHLFTMSTVNNQAKANLRRSLPIQKDRVTPGEQTNCVETSFSHHPPLPLRFRVTSGIR